MEDRGSASQKTDSALQRIPYAGGASPSLKDQPMDMQYIAEILFGIAAVITALKAGATKKK